MEEGLRQRSRMRTIGLGQRKAGTHLSFFFFFFHLAGGRSIEIRSDTKCIDDNIVSDIWAGWRKLFVLGKRERKAGNKGKEDKERKGEEKNSFEMFIWTEARNGGRRRRPRQTSIQLAGGDDWTDPTVLCTRFIRTYEMLLEGDAGAPVLLSTFTSFDSFAGQTWAVAAAQVLNGADESGEGVGLPNTNLVILGGRLCPG